MLQFYLSRVGVFGENESMEENPPVTLPKTPLAPEDFYFEGPNLVFTAAYHLKRGSCCGSGCRHCPYGFAKTPEQAIRPEAQSGDAPIED
ncbi:MAG: DUF5522 domain-containing protein [Terracidiphilus sp.]|jgi:hypothetical protein